MNLDLAFLEWRNISAVLHLYTSFLPLPTSLTPSASANHCLSYATQRKWSKELSFSIPSPVRSVNKDPRWSKNRSRRLYIYVQKFALERGWAEQRPWHSLPNPHPISQLIIRRYRYSPPRRRILRTFISVLIFKLFCTKSEGGGGRRALLSSLSLYSLCPAVVREVVASGTKWICFVPVGEGEGHWKGWALKIT